MEEHVQILERLVSALADLEELIVHMVKYIILCLHCSSIYQVIHTS